MTPTQVLKEEFEAADGSFLLQLRIDLRWDVAAFDRVTSAMLEVVKARDPVDPIPRWLAEGYWYLDWYVRKWTSHEAFPRPHSSSYYEEAYERIHDLAYWLFFGESPYQNGSGFGPLAP